MILAANESVKINIVFLLTLALAALWNIPDTIAARYIASSIALLICSIGSFKFLLKINYKSIYFLFLIYVLYNLFFNSSDFYYALENFNGEWLKYFLYSALGWLSSRYICKFSNKKILISFGLAFLLPSIIYILHLLLFFTIEGYIPDGFRSVFKSPGELAYSSLSGVIFLGVYIIFSKDLIANKFIVLIVLIISGLMPLLIMHSRGGLLFFFLTFAILFIIGIMDGNLKLKICLLALFLVFPLTMMVIQKTDINKNISRLLIVKNIEPIRFFCDGSAPIIAKLKNELGGVSDEDIKDIQRVEDGDPIRLSGFLAGVKLAIMNPEGINQSKDGFQIAIKRICKEPKVLISHSHNGWIDTALSIGILGAILLMMVMLSHVLQGFEVVRSGGVDKPIGVALAATALIWLLRACVDSTIRDQMLEVQGFSLALLSGIIFFRNKIVISKNVLG